MTRRTIKDLSASVHQRLLNKARETDRPFNELLQYFAMERFLYRLSRSSYANRFVLKGALMFTVWEASPSRSTMDIDLLGRGDNQMDTVATVAREICLEKVEPDGMAFDDTTVQAERIAKDADYEGVRVRFRASLGPARIVMQLDVGFGNVVTPSDESVIFPTILDFPAPQLQAYNRETTVAEKFETMVKLGILNSRMKDFFDIWLLSHQFDFEGDMLAQAITNTFAARGTDVPSKPAAFTAGFVEDAEKTAQWQAFARRNPLSTMPEDFREVIADVTAFLKPIAESLAMNRCFLMHWHPPGPWSK